MWFVGVFVAFVAFMVRSVMIIITSLLEFIIEVIANSIKRYFEHRKSKKLSSENISYSKSTETIKRKPRNCTANEEYECERCLKSISREEYELYDCMCESCFEDVSYKHDDTF